MTTCQKPRAIAQVLIVIATFGCEGEPARPPPAAQPDDSRLCNGAGSTLDADEEQMPEITCAQGERQILCFGAWAAHCDAKGTLVDVDNCREDGLLCAARLCDDADDCQGCGQCIPGSTRCGDDGARLECDEDGSGYTMVEVCDEGAGARCSVASGKCEDLCAAAEREQSYIGCDYWAVATSNAQLDFIGIDDEGLCQPFTFAIVVANPQGIAAHVRIESPGREAQTYTVKPASTRTIPLPCSPALKGGVMLDDPNLTEEDYLEQLLANTFTQRVPDAAHHIISDVPVTVYQFNPLEFEVALNPDGSVASDTDEGNGRDLERVYSHTNDASLLLPTHAMTGNYTVMASPTLFHQINPPEDSGEDPVDLFGPGFMALIGVDETPVEVELTSSAWTMPSKDGSFPALGPGDSHTFTIARGEVVQITSQPPERCTPSETVDPIGRGATRHYCKVGKDFDLTGSRVRASGKVSVISGHDCAFLPFDRWACDHIEETMFPVESWGQEIVIGVSQAAECQPDIPNAVRVISDSDGNRVNFVPEVHEPVVLDRGEYVDFEVTSAVRISASAAILVAQYLLGQDYGGFQPGSVLGKGDPALSLGIPFEQWRNDYAFLAPESFPENYVNVIANERQLILLDDQGITGFHPIEGTKLQIARIRVAGGQHRIHSAENFGIVVYGYAPYTSFMVPGGLDLNRINRPD